MDKTQEGRKEVVLPSLIFFSTYRPAVVTEKIAMKLGTMNRTQEGREQAVLPILVLSTTALPAGVAVTKEIVLTLGGMDFQDVPAILKIQTIMASIQWELAAAQEGQGI